MKGQVAWLWLAVICLTGNVARVSGQEIDVHLSKIDTGVAWVSSYWGYNAPKLVYDGESYYTVALWGPEQATARGGALPIARRSVAPRLRVGRLELPAGHGVARRATTAAPDLSKDQPKASHFCGLPAPGQIDQFEQLKVPDAIGKAGYMGAGIYDERLVIGYIGDPATYTFKTAMLDLRTGTWDGPYVLAPAQRTEVPWTTWLYPVIQPDETGYHLLVSNQPDPRALYNRILYMHLPYGDPGQIEPEVVVEIAPEGDFIAFGEAMWRDLDGYIYVTGQYQSPEQVNQLFVFVRDPHTGAWTRQALSNAQVAAAYQRPVETVPCG